MASAISLDAILTLLDILVSSLKVVHTLTSPRLYRYDTRDLHHPLFGHEACPANECKWGPYCTKCFSLHSPSLTGVSAPKDGGFIGEIRYFECSRRASVECRRFKI